MNSNKPVRQPWHCAAGLLLVLVNTVDVVHAGCELTFDPTTGQTGFMGHPCPQPRPGPSRQVEHPDGSMEIWTPPGHFPSVDPFTNPPGSNFLLTVHENLRDFLGNEMPNTLPSTPTNPYNLHDGPVLTESIDPTSPEEDLDRIIRRIERAAAKHGKVKEKWVRFGIDILEGNPVENRAYSGFPMLHYNGCLKQKTVQPLFDAQGRVTGGNVDVNLIYFGQRIEGDTAFVDPTAVQEVPWTITYHVNILHGGKEDFSPMVMNFDRIRDVDGKEVRGPFHASFDQTFFPMLDEGTRYTIRIKQTKGKYYNLTYIWGWRIHPPRVQVIENALKKAPPGPNAKSLPDWECDTFGDPSVTRGAKLDAIAMIGDLSPAKRMWNLFHDMLASGQSREPVEDDDDSTEAADKHHGKRLKFRKKALEKFARELRAAFLDWKDRTHLPSGVTADPNADLTLLYVNNTLYGSRQGMQGHGSGLGQGSYKGVSNGSVPGWTTRPYLYHVTLLNGDHFPHGYMNVDFGGSRGWENQFQFSDPTTLAGPHPEVPPDHPAADLPYTDPANLVAGMDQVFPINRGGTEEFLQPTPRNPDDPINGAPLLGSGCFFTFGRNYAWPNAGGPWGAFGVPPVSADGSPGRRKVTIHYNFEPSRRLRIYQFDPLHHDVAVYSLH